MPSPHFGHWREHFAGVDLPVPVSGGGTVTGINFDNAASTPPLKRVRDAVTGFSEVYSSVHRGTGYKSRLATEAYEHARELVAHFLGVDERSQVVIFVKGTIDALNRIAAEQARLDGRQVLVTEMEHHADLLPWRHRTGHVMVGLSDDGHIDLDAIDRELKAAALSHEWGIAVRNGCFCANPYVFHLLHMDKKAVDAVEGEVTAGHRKALPGAVRASLAPYNTSTEVERFVDAVTHIARGKLNATYEQAADGTFSPAGGWPRIPNPLKTLVNPAPRGRD